MAKATIHYFSGTGNTRRGVDIIAEALRGSGWEVELLPMEPRGPERRAPSDETGAALPELTVLAFPTLAWNPPAFVKRYARRLPRGEGRRAAVFATWGGEGLAALARAARILERRGYEVGAAAGALYPSNWTQFEDGPDTEAARAGLERGDADALAFARFLAAGEEANALAAGEFARPRPSPGYSAWTSVVAFLFGLMGRRFLGKLFVADRSCSGCGLCAKACPAAAIAMREAKGGSRPRWSFSCENCNRCLNICPSRSLQSSIFRITYHMTVLCTLTSVAVSGAGAAAGAVAASGGAPVARAAAWLGAFAANEVLALWLQFGPLDALAFALEARISALRETGYTKEYKRYLAEGFKPLAERRRED